MNDDLLAQRLFALVRDQGATDALGLAVMQSVFDVGSDPFYVIADAITYLDDDTIPADVATAYAAYRSRVTNPTWLEILRPLPASLVA